MLVTALSAIRCSLLVAIVARRGLAASSFASDTAVASVTTWCRCVRYWAVRAQPHPSKGMQHATYEAVRPIEHATSVVEAMFSECCRSSDSCRIGVAAFLIERTVVWLACAARIANVKVQLRSRSCLCCVAAQIALPLLIRQCCGNTVKPLQATDLTTNALSPAVRLQACCDAASVDRCAHGAS